MKLHSTHRILKSKPGGATKEVLRRFAQGIQGDIFALEQQGKKVAKFEQPSKMGIEQELANTKLEKDIESLPYCVESLDVFTYKFGLEYVL